MNIIETARLVLREFNTGDLDAMHAVLSDPAAMAYYPEPFDLEMTRKWIQRNIDRYRELGFGLWAVILKETGDLIGDCGLTLQYIDEVAELEIGYHILRAYWGRGLGAEGAVACRDYAFDNLGRQRVISWMHPDNIASRRVAEKTGMRLEKFTNNTKGRPAVVYSMKNTDRGFQGNSLPAVL